MSTAQLLVLLVAAAPAIAAVLLAGFDALLDLLVLTAPDSLEETP